MGYVLSLALLIFCIFSKMPFADAWMLYISSAIFAVAGAIGNVATAISNLNFELKIIRSDSKEKTE